MLLTVPLLLFLQLQLLFININYDYTAAKTQMVRILWQELLLWDIMESRTMAKQQEDKSTGMQMLSHIASKDYVTLKRDAEDRSSWQQSLSYINLP